MFNICGGTFCCVRVEEWGGLVSVTIVDEDGLIWIERAVVVLFL